MKHRTLLTLLLALAAAACDAAPTLAPEPSRAPDAPNEQTWAWCQTNPECQLGDPRPSEPGIYLGDDFSVMNCFQGASAPGGDMDRDFIGDVCEREIAVAFAPVLRYSQYDAYMGREPYWAVHPISDGVSGYVRVIYALAYYADGGNQWGGCSVSLPVCQGHLGDSEHLILDLAYSDWSRHWILQRAWYSAHGSLNEYDGGLLAYPGGKPRSYPEAWVALQKHANYRSKAACEAGGTVSSDTCDGLGSARVAVVPGRNLGWNSWRLLNCVGSQGNTSLMALGYQECFWTGAYFTGWSGDNSGGVESYGSILQRAGFFSAPVNLALL